MAQEAPAPPATGEPPAGEPTPPEPTDKGQKPKGESGFDSLPAETQAEIKKLRAEAAANRTAAKEAQAKVEEYEQANASELEKAQSKTAKETKRAEEAEAKLLRFTVAQEKEVPAKLVPLLTASTREELEAQADLILENAKPANPAFDGGAREPAPEPKTPEQQHNEALLALAGRKPIT